MRPLKHFGRDSCMICLNTDGQNSVSDADIIRETAVLTMRREKTEDILLHGCTIREGISIITSTGLITVWMAPGS